MTHQITSTRISLSRVHVCRPHRCSDHRVSSTSDQGSDHTSIHHDSESLRDNETWWASLEHCCRGGDRGNSCHGNLRQMQHETASRAQPCNNVGQVTSEARGYVNHHVVALHPAYFEVVITFACMKLILSTYKFEGPFFRHERRIATKFGTHVRIETRLALT